MLSYQHLYHAGNFADLHKHALLAQALGHAIARYPKLHYFDSHAGEGRYDLQSPAARKTNEAASGFLQTHTQPPPPLLAPLYDIQDAINNHGSIRFYGGSPAIAAALLRPTDRATLIERHPTAFNNLRKYYRQDQRLEIVRDNGFEVLAKFPLGADWPSLVLIDPPYEQKHEIEAVLGLVGTIIRRWRQATILLWFPLLADQRHQLMIEGLGQLKLAKTALSLLHRPPVEGESLRMIGSGMAVIGRALPPPLNPITNQLATWMGVTGETRFLANNPQKR